MAADVVGEWLSSLEISYDIALAPTLAGIDWRSVSPQQYDVVVFVCGPFSPGPLEAAFFEHFDSNRIVGVDLSLAEAVSVWNPFDTLLERDSPSTGRPDLVFAARTPRVPLIGVCLVEDYPGADTVQANAKVDELLAQVEGARIDIDTRLDTNLSGLRNKAEVEAALNGMDVVVTTRLHGMVLALKNGVPVVAIDPAPKGAKIMQQAKTVGWPMCFVASTVSAEELHRAFTFCLSAQAKTQARACARTALDLLSEVRHDFADALFADDKTDESLKVSSKMRLAQVGHQVQRRRASPIARALRTLRKFAPGK